MDIQFFIAMAIVAAAAFYLVKTLWSKSKGRACESGKCGCEKPNITLRN